VVVPLLRLWLLLLEVPLEGGTTLVVERLVALLDFAVVALLALVVSGMPVGMDCVGCGGSEDSGGDTGGRSVGLEPLTGTAEVAFCACAVVPGVLVVAVVAAVAVLSERLVVLMGSAVVAF